MKYFLIILITAFSTQLSIAQANEKGLKKDLKHYYQLTLDNDFNAIVDYVNPKMFEFVTKEMLVNSFEETFSDEEIKLAINEVKNEKIYPIIKMDSTSYTMIDYSLKMSIRLNMNEEEDEDFADSLSGIYESMYGEENVEFESKNQTYRIHVDKSMFAEYVDNRWTFINQEEGMDYIINAVIPEQVQEKMNENYSK